MAKTSGRLSNNLERRPGIQQPRGPEKSRATNALHHETVIRGTRESLQGVVQSTPPLGLDDSSLPNFIALEEVQEPPRKPQEVRRDAQKPTGEIDVGFALRNDRELTESDEEGGLGRLLADLTLTGSSPSQPTDRKPSVPAAKPARQQRVSKRSSLISRLRIEKENDIKGLLLKFIRNIIS